MQMKNAKTSNRLSTKEEENVITDLLCKEGFVGEKKNKPVMYRMWKKRWNRKRKLATTN